MALHGAGQVQQAARGKILALEVERMPLCGRVKLAAGAVGPVKGIVVPAIPQGLGQGDEFVGARIALRMAARCIDAEIARRVFGERGNDIQPARPPLRWSSELNLRAT